MVAGRTEYKSAGLFNRCGLKMVQSLLLGSVHLVSAWAGFSGVFWVFLVSAAVVVDV